MNKTYINKKLGYFIAWWFENNSFNLQAKKTKQAKLFYSQYYTLINVKL